MLQIRAAQVSEISKALASQFAVRLERHLQSTFPKETETLGPPALKALVQDGIAISNKHDIVMDHDVQRYLECMVVYSPDFDTNSRTSWAGQILRDESLDGTQKMNRISDYEVFQLRRG